MKFLKANGYWVRGVDTEAPEFEEYAKPMSSFSSDLREVDALPEVDK